MSSARLPWRGERRRPPQLLTLSFALLSLIAMPRHGSGEPASQPAASRPAAGAAGPGEPGTRRLHLLFTTDLFGRYAWPGCPSPGADRGADFSQLITALQQTRQAIAAQGEGPALVVHAGSVTRFDIMGEHAFTSEADAGAAVELLRQARFDAISAGQHDFGAAPASFERYLRLGRRAGLPLVSSNVTCATGERCRAFREGTTTQLLLRRGGLKVGLLSVARADLASRVLPRSRPGLKVAKVVPAVRRGIKALRTQGAALVVLLAEVNVEGEAPRPVLQLLEELGSDAPDLVVAGGMYAHRGGDYLLHVRRGLGAPILGTDRFGQHLGHAVVSYLPPAGPGRQPRVRDVSVRTLRTRDFPVAPTAAPLVARLRRSLCSQVAKPLGQARLVQPMTYPEFMTYLMQVMRRRVRAEVAVLNDSAISDTTFPLSGHLTLESILRAIRTGTTVGTVTVTGARLRGLLGPHLAEGTGLRVLGLRRQGTKYYVNDRPLIDGQRYRFAATAFVAKGGDHLLSLKKVERYRDGGRTLRQVAATFFASDGPGIYDGIPTVDPKTDFPHLGQRWVVYGGLSTAVNVEQVAAYNGEAGERYDRSLLKRDDLLGLGVNVSGYLGASVVDHTLELDAALEYGRTWTRPQGETDRTSVETNDRVVSNLLYKLTRLRRWCGAERFYIPDPYAEMSFQSELSESGTYEDAAGVTGSYRLAELSGSVGPGFTLHPLLFIKAGLGVRGDLLAPDAADPELATDLGLYLGYTLRRIKLLAATPTPFQLESRLDFFLTGIQAARRAEVTLESKVLLPLGSVLSLVVGHRLYLFDAADRSMSVSSDLTVGLGIGLSRRHQTF